MITNKFLSNLVIYSKYASYKPELNRRQTWEECIGDLKEMHMKKHPGITDEIEENFKLIYDKLVLPSMRSVQFGGKPIEFSPNKIYNCAFLAIDNPFAFAEILFLLLGGTGVGYSVQARHISRLPVVKQPEGRRRYLIGDSIEGWADSLRALIYAYLRGKPMPTFDYRDIRPKGTPIKKSGGIAPGPDQLQISHERIKKVLDQAIGRKLTSLEVHDMVCYTADCVLSGGVRTSALICLFDKDDKSILRCKRNFTCTGARVVEDTATEWKIKATIVKNGVMDINCYTGTDDHVITINKLNGGEYDKDTILSKGEIPWYYLHPQRAMANNSVILKRDEVTKDEFAEFWEILKKNGTGEPGILWVNDYDHGTNPCLTGDMMLATKDGYKSMYKLWCEGGYEVYSKDKQLSEYGEMEIVNNASGIAKSTKVYKTSDLSNIYEVTFDDGSKIRSTKNHDYWTLNHDGSRQKVKLSSLTIGDRVEPCFNSSFGTKDAREFASIIGFILGNGSYLRKNESVEYYIKLYNNPGDLLEKLMASIKMTGWFHDVSCEQDRDDEKYNYIRFSCHDVPGGNYMSLDGQIPEFVYEGTKETAAAFLRAMFTSAGYVKYNKDDNPSIRLWRSDYKLLSGVKLLLSQFGVQSSLFKRNLVKNNIHAEGDANLNTGFELVIGGYVDVVAFIREISFFQEERNSAIAEKAKGFENKKVSRRYVRVSCIKYVGSEPTFCLTEPANSEISVNGIIISQCAAGEVRLATKGGYKTMKEAWEEGGKQEYSPEKSHKEYGEQMDVVNDKGVRKASAVYRTSVSDELYDVEMNDGGVHTLTKYHDFIVEENGIRRKVKVKDLKPGMKSPYLLTRSFGTEHNPEYARVAGWIIGDGSICTKGDYQEAILRFWGEDIREALPKLRKDLLKAYGIYNTSSNQNPEYAGFDGSSDGFDCKRKDVCSRLIGRLMKEDGLVPGCKHTIPASIWRSDEKTIAAFLCGLFSADGSVNTGKNGQIAVQLYQSNQGFLRDVKILLSQMGIISSVMPSKKEELKMLNDGSGGKKEYMCKASFRLKVTGIHECRKYLKDVGFLQDSKSEKLRRWLDDHAHSRGIKVKTHATVKKITFNRVGEAFCLTEPETHTVSFNGLLSGNCGEIGLASKQFCNLTTNVVYGVQSQEELHKLVRASTFLGTLQASHTDFHYLRPEWRENTEKDALLGVSMTGIASGNVLGLSLHEAAKVALEENSRVARLIGINEAARVTAIKPEGSGTLAAGVLGNGIHAIHSPYFVRNVRIKKHDPVYRFLKERMPQFVADEFGREELSAVVSIPIKAPGGGIFRTESVLDLLERIKKFNIEWIKAGHRRDSNSNNVSATVYIKGDSEWAEVFEWVWDNRFHYNGMTFLPDYGDGGGYKQAPFIDMTKEEYEDMVKEFPENIDFREVYGTNHKSFEADAACSGGSCEIKHL